MAKKTADQLDREMRAKMLKTTPQQQRNIDKRAAEQNRYYNDPKARTERANAELDKARKSSNAMKPPVAPMPASENPKKTALQRFKGLGGLGALRGGGAGFPRVR